MIVPKEVELFLALSTTQRHLRSPVRTCPFTEWFVEAVGDRPTFHPRPRRVGRTHGAEFQGRLFLAGHSPRLRRQPRHGQRSTPRSPSCSTAPAGATTTLNLRRMWMTEQSREELAEVQSRRHSQDALAGEDDRAWGRPDGSCKHDSVALAGFVRFVNQTMGGGG